MAYVKDFAETGHSLEGEEPLTLQEIQKKVAEQRADQEKLQRTVASDVIIGMYQVIGIYVYICHRHIYMS